MQAVIIAVVITFIVTCAITWFVANAYQKKQTASKIGSAEDKAREIIDEAVKTAETKKRESCLRLKKSRFVRRTNWTRKSRKEETKFRETSAEWNRRNPIWIRNWKPLRSAKQVLQQKKKS